MTCTGVSSGTSSTSRRRAGDAGFDRGRGTRRRFEGSQARFERRHQRQQAGGFSEQERIRRLQRLVRGEQPLGCGLGQHDCIVARPPATRPHSEHLQLGDVATSVLGVSGRAMLAAIVAGETDASALADLAHGLLRKKREALEAALAGRVRPITACC